MSQSQESKADAAQQRSEETRSFVRTVKVATRRRYTPEEKNRVGDEGRGGVPEWREASVANRVKPELPISNRLDPSKVPSSTRAILERIIQTEPHAASRAPCSGQPRYDHDSLTDTCSYPGLKRSLPIRSSISSNISLVTITSASWNTSLLA